MTDRNSLELNETVRVKCGPYVGEVGVVCRAFKQIQDYHVRLISGNIIRVCRNDLEKGEQQSHFISTERPLATNAIDASEPPSAAQPDEVMAQVINCTFSPGTKSAGVKNDTTTVYNKKVRTYSPARFSCAAESFNVLSPIPKQKKLDLGDGRTLGIVNWAPKGSPDHNGVLPVELTAIIQMDEKPEVCTAKGQIELLRAENKELEDRIKILLATAAADAKQLKEALDRVDQLGHDSRRQKGNWADQSLRMEQEILNLRSERDVAKQEIRVLEQRIRDLQEK